jgi:hypothetical protein
VTQAISSESTLHASWRVVWLGQPKIGPWVRLTANSLQTRCKLIANSLQTHCKLVANSLQTHCKLVANSLQTHCKLTAKSLSTRYQKPDTSKDRMLDMCLSAQSRLSSARLLRTRRNQLRASPRDP